MTVVCEALEMAYHAFSVYSPQSLVALGVNTA